jgi:hypothetical protein
MPDESSSAERRDKNHLEKRDEFDVGAFVRNKSGTFSSA